MKMHDKRDELLPINYKFITCLLWN